MQDFNTTPIELFEYLSSVTDDYMFIVDYIGDRVYWSDSALIDLGLLKQENIENSKARYLSLIHPDDTSDKYAEIREYRIKNVDGQYNKVQVRTMKKYNEDGAPILCVGIIKKSGAEQCESEISRHAVSAFKRDVSDMIEANALKGGIIDFCLGDIRHLNAIHSYSYVSQILSAMVREISRISPQDTRVYRVQGNHILLCCPKLSRDEIAVLCSKIHAVVPEKIHKINKINISIPCGVVMVEEIVPLTFDNLWKGLTYCSGLAAKNRIYDEPVFYSPEKFRDAVTKLSLIDELKYAVKRDINSFMLYYQPIIDPATNRLMSAEALLRWKSPLLEKFGLSIIIKQLEITGLIIPLGRWIISTALSELKRWQAYKPDMHVNINVATPQLNDTGLTKFIEDELKTNSLDGSSVTFEITETYEIKNMSAAVRFIEEIHALGADVALDDFGTGNCSLGELKVLPVDWIKVDQNFVLDVAQNKVDQSILKHLMDLSRSLNIKICVEGVGSYESLEVVQQYLPESVQGFHFSTPLPRDEFFETFIKNHD